VRRRRHRRMRLATQKRHFAEKVSGLNIIEHLLPSASTLLGDFDRAFADQIKGIAQIAFLENDIPALELQDVDVGPDSFQHLRADALKEPVLTQLFEGFCGCGSHRSFKRQRRYRSMCCLPWTVLLLK